MSTQSSRFESLVVPRRRGFEQDVREGDDPKARRSAKPADKDTPQGFAALLEA
jgi:hypothetical protein